MRQSRAVSGPTLNVDRAVHAAMTLACVIMTPLGVPVVPLVKQIVHRSVGRGGVCKHIITNIYINSAGT